MKTEYKAPFSLFFVWASVLVFLIDQYVVNGLIQSYFISPTAFSDNYSFLRLILYPLGNMTGTTLSLHCLLVLLLGILLEKHLSYVQTICIVIIATLVAGIIGIFIRSPSMYGGNILILTMATMLVVFSIQRRNFSLILFTTIALIIFYEQANLNGRELLSIAAGTLAGVGYGLTIRQKV